MKRQAVHLTSVHQPYDPRIFHRECRTLAQSGYQVVVVAPAGRDETADGIRIHAVPRPAGRRERFLHTVWHVYRAACREGAQLYHIHDPELIPVGLLLRLRGKHVIYDVHENLPQQIQSKHWIPRGLRRLVGAAAGAAELLAAYCFSGIVAATPQIGRRFPGWKTVVVQNFPPLNRPAVVDARPYRERSPVAVYAGAITRLRGLVQMVDALALIPEHLDVRLCLAGRFDSPALASEARQRPGWGRVQFAGWLGPAELAALYGRARVGLVVLHPTPAYRESYAIKLFEYMAAGLPVVASDFPLWRAIIGGAQCGLVVDPLDPAAIARAIRFLIEHPDDAEAMGRKGQQAILLRYNWEREAAKLLALYERIGR